MFSQLPNRNNTNFPLALATALGDIEHDKVLQHHQNIIHHYMVGNPGSRGLLIFNEPGTGKTIAAASIAMSMRDHRDIVLLSAKSLHSNFREDVTKYIQMRDPSITTVKINAMIESQFSFISMNASNMMNQMARSGKTQDEIEYEERMGRLAAESNLEGKLLIVDEAHDLFNSIVGGGANAQKLYHAIMKTRNIKILFLTGSPIINDPFELVAAYNMCAGYDLLPTDYAYFNTMFVDHKTNMMKNRNIFMNRIYGLTSYYGAWYSTGGTYDPKATIRRVDFPDQLPLKIEVVKMSDHQYSLYTAVRERERKQDERTARGPARETPAMHKPAGSGTSYRVYSRQICNFARPDTAKTTEGTDVDAKLTQIPEDISTNLTKYSPKMDRILHHIVSHPKHKHAVYSSFVHNAGVGVFAKVLEANGYVRWGSPTGRVHYGRRSGGVSASTGSELGVKVSDRDPVRRYAMFSGDQSADERAATREAFNSDINALGDEIHVILLSGAGAQGLNLMAVKHIYIMEPYWNWIRIVQTIARAVRFKGHNQLKPEDRTVQPYIFISEYPDYVDKKKANEPTTDAHLYTNSVNGRQLHHKFYTAMIESSFDCHAHIKNASDVAKTKIKCMSCAPTSKPLFHQDIDTDLGVTNPCKAVKHKKVTAKPVSYMGKKYWYAWDSDTHTADVWEMKKSVNAYVAVGADNIAYPHIIAAITDIEETLR